jgi:hypothetical protein
MFNVIEQQVSLLKCELKLEIVKLRLLQLGTLPVVNLGNGFPVLVNQMAQFHFQNIAQTIG